LFKKSNNSGFAGTIVFSLAGVHAPQALKKPLQAAEFIIVF
jgi:hypothetical protein